MKSLWVLLFFVGQFKTESNLVTSPDPDVPIDCDKICGDQTEGVTGEAFTKFECLRSLTEILQVLAAVNTTVNVQVIP